MSFAAVSGASIICTMGLGIGMFTATSQMVCLAGGKPMGTIRDTGPLINVGTCGMCTSLLNPTVSAATAAALGVLTPQPCIPSPVGVWLPGSQTMAGNTPCITIESKLTCAYGGSIGITAPGQTKVIL